MNRHFQFASLILAAGVAAVAQTPDNHIYRSGLGEEAVPAGGHNDALELLGGTFRLVVTPHLGGSTLRVHVSNRFGRAG